MAQHHHHAPMALELEDGTFCQGFSFGAPRGVAGELVFQTGMVGYPESITDPSYRGQILVITFPLVGNYGVPPRDEKDKILPDLPAHFEAAEIHIAGLVVAAYAGDEYSHHLANSSLAAWLKEQGVPAVYGVDTRALTKRIREKGSMLGRLLQSREAPSGPSLVVNGTLTAPDLPNGITKKVENFEVVPWYNPNEQNLVAEGELVLPFHFAMPAV